MTSPKRLSKFEKDIGVKGSIVHLGSENDVFFGLILIRVCCHSSLELASFKFESMDRSSHLTTRRKSSMDCSITQFGTLHADRDASGCG